MIATIKCFFKGHNFKKEDGRLFCTNCGRVIKCLHKWERIEKINILDHNDAKKYTQGKKEETVPIGYKLILQCKYCGEEKKIEI